MSDVPLPRPVTVLGLAGIAPQVALLASAALVPQDRWFALAAGCFYAALILSFLGGLWWMAGLLRGRTDWSTYTIAVLPSLAGWLALLPWSFGWAWPSPSLLLLGLALLASPLVDRLLAPGLDLPTGWLRLRTLMASGLGLSTIVLSLV